MAVASRDVDSEGDQVHKHRERRATTEYLGEYCLHVLDPRMDMLPSSRRPPRSPASAVALRLLMLPTCAWVTVAAALNLRIWWLNRA